MIRFVALTALVFASAAGANDGWTGYAGIGFTPTPRGEAAPILPVGADVPDTVFTDETPAAKDGVAGAKGDKGDKGEPGATGPQGTAGVNADLCQNIPGVQTTPGSKYNAQRFWSFLPKWEMRFLAVNGKRQLVCVTQRWLRNHGGGKR